MLAYKDSNLERLNQNQLCYQLHHRPLLNRGCKFKLFLESAKIKNAIFAEPNWARNRYYYAVRTQANAAPFIVASILCCAYGLWANRRAYK